MSPKVQVTVDLTVFLPVALSGALLVALANNFWAMSPPSVSWWVGSWGSPRAAQSFLL